MGKVKMTPAWHRLAKRLKSVSDKQVRVGIFGEKGGNGTYEGSDITIAEVAAIHEYGSRKARIPQRSFIRSTINENRAMIQNLLTRLGQGVVDGKLSDQQALELLGVQVSAMIRKKITGTPPLSPALKPETIARKKSDRPLVDTGQLVNSITHVVEDKNKR